MKRRVCIRHTRLRFATALGLCLITAPARSTVFTHAQEPQKLITEDTAKRVDVFSKELIEFVKRYRDAYDGLKKNPSTPLSSAELDELSASGNRLKAAFAGFERDLTKFIRDLKKARKWTPAFDREIKTLSSRLNADSSAKTRFLKWIDANGGARAVLEQALKLAGGAGDAIDRGVSDLRARGGRWKALYVSNRDPLVLYDYYFAYNYCYYWGAAGTWMIGGAVGPGPGPGGVFGCYWCQLG